MYTFLVEDFSDPCQSEARKSRLQSKRWVSLNSDLLCHDSDKPTRYGKWDAAR